MSCTVSDVIISNSEAGIKAYNINNQDKKKVIYNGVRLERFKLNINKNDIRNKLKVNTKFMVIMVAKMSNNKDYDLFLDVARLISKLRNDVTFVGVGDGPNFEKIKCRIRNEHIINVSLTGKRNNVEELVAVSDIGILFTNNNVHGEGISNSIIEYMASAKPVITTDIVGGSREILVNEEAGFIMERNANVIVEKINRLLDDDNLRKSMGDKGKKIIDAKFTIAQMGNEYLKVYDSFN